MNVAATPSSVGDLVEIIRGAPRVIATGGLTKERLSRIKEGCIQISMRQLRGITQYDPAEYTFTALGGTPLVEIAAALAEHGQHLPFDPLFVQAGSTLGGTVAAGSHGPGRIRYGGIRDFILGVRFIDGDGRALHAGGNVVKNAAGFDLPKFFVGSCGRFGVITEITCKVFPKPASTLTLRLAVADPETTAQNIIQIANGRWEVDALDLPPGESVCVRLAGPISALEPMAQEILNRWGGSLVPASNQAGLWNGLNEARWRHPEGALIKVPITPLNVPALMKEINALPGARLHVSAGGQVAFISLSDPAHTIILHGWLEKQNLAALTLCGEGPLWLGRRPVWKVAEFVKKALDAHGRYPSFEE